MSPPARDAKRRTLTLETPHLNFIWERRPFLPQVVEHSNSTPIQPQIVAEMPSTVKDKAVKSVVKRKRSETGEPIKKRKKSESGEEKEDLVAQIHNLESQINESKKHYNNIATLIEYAEKQNEDPKTAISAAEALCRVFVRLLASGSLVKKKDASEKDATVAKWLRDRLTDHHKALVAMFKSTKLATQALVLAMALLKAEAQYLEGKDEAVFPWPLFNAIISALLTSPVDEVRDEFCDKFIDEYDDIRFYTFEGIKYVESVGPKWTTVPSC